MSPPRSENQGDKPKLGGPSWPLVGIGLLVLLLVVIAVIWAATDGTVVTEKTQGTTKTTTTEAVPSDTLIGVGLALAGVLIVLGMLWSRIASIKGAGIEVTLDSDEVGETKDAVAETARQMNKTEPEAVATATTRAIKKVERRKAEKGTLHTQDFVEAAEEAMESVR